MLKSNAKTLWKLKLEVHANSTGIFFQGGLLEKLVEVLQHIHTIHQLSQCENLPCSID